MPSGATVSGRAGRAEQAILRGVSAISGTTRLVGILGWPVEHSLSPRMQNAAFAALGLDWAYVPLPAPPERLADALKGLLELGFVGANVTSYVNTGLKRGKTYYYRVRANGSPAPSAWSNTASATAN